MAIQEYSENRRCKTCTGVTAGQFVTDRDTKAHVIHSCGTERTAGKKLNTKERKQNINSDKQTDAFDTLLLGLSSQTYLQHGLYSQVKKSSLV